MAIAPAGYPRPSAPSTGWPILACAAGLLALPAAFLPHGVGLLAVVFAGVGIAAGVVARVRGAPRGRLAVTGIVTSTLAVVMAIVLAVIYQTGSGTVKSPAAERSWVHLNDNLDEILRDQLRVGFGIVDPTAQRALLPVSLTNRLDRSATFHLVVAGFVGDREIARDTELVTLAAKTTQHVRMFHRYYRLDEQQIAQLPKAHFQVVEADTFWYAE